MVNNDLANVDLEPEARQRVVPAEPAVALTRTPQVLELMAMSSDNIGELFGALAEAQGNFGTVERTLKAKISGKANYTYEYETLADLLLAVRPATSAAGLALMQFPTTRRDGNVLWVVLKTMLGHRSGQWISSDIQAASDAYDPRAVGSVITYLRRYALKSLLGIAPESDDDDGAAGSGERADGARTDGPRPAQRVSQQQAEKKADAPVVKAAAEPAEKVPGPVGTVQDLQERGGAAIVRLSSGFVAATRSGEVIDALKRHASTSQVVELVTRASTDPSRYAPVITEVILQSREPGEDG